MARRKAKALKAPGVMRTVLAANVTALMERRLPMYADKIRELARRAGMSRSSVQRIVAAEHGASIDLVEKLADALGVAVYQLVMPGLDSASPQQVPGSFDALVKALRQWKRGRSTP